MTVSRPERRAGDLETRWRQVLESAHEVYVALDGEGVIADWNRAAASLFGVTKQQVLGTHVERFVPERCRSVFRESLRAAVERTDAALTDPVEVDLRKDRGIEFTAECLVWGVDRRGGLLVHCFVRDVTERRRSEQAAALLAAVVESSADPIVTEGPDQRIVTWNAAAERTYGWAAQEAVGASALLVVPEDKVDEHLRLVEAVLSDVPVRGVETERLTRGGTPVPRSPSPWPCATRRW